MKSRRCIVIFFTFLMVFAGRVFAEQAVSADLLDVTINDIPSNFSFSGSKYLYENLIMPNSASSITMMPNGNGVISMKVDGGDPIILNSGFASNPISLTPGIEKVIEIITEETDSLPKTYTFKVTRELDSNKKITTFDLIGVGEIDEANHIIRVTVPFGTDVSSLTPNITMTGASIFPGLGGPQNFTNPVTYTVTAFDSSTIDYIVTVTFDTDPDIALITADKNALTDIFIKGENLDLDNVTLPLVNPLPSLGINGSSISWSSDNKDVLSDDGQIINRPIFSKGDSLVKMRASFSKGIETDTKDFILKILRLPASSITDILSSIYQISKTEELNSITNVPFGTEKNVFLASLAKGELNQTWNDNGISDPVLSGDTLIVTAEDGLSQLTYTVSVNDKIVNHGGGGGVMLIQNSGNITKLNNIVSSIGKVLGASTYNFTLTLRKGSIGEEVTELQKFLNTNGYDCGEEDGIFGAKTKAAVLRFQIANGIMNGFGTVGPLTRVLLNK